jgi:hypothetical protein
MLARPEIGSKEHILLWLASRDPDEEYDWDEWRVCARGQYCFEHFGEHANWPQFSLSAPVHQMDYYAQHHRTFGALYEVMRKQWA